MDAERQIAELANRLSSVEEDLRSLQQNAANVPTLAAAPVSNSPTASGYVPFIINGKRINLLQGS